jgi:hypothetical protein
MKMETESDGAASIPLLAFVIVSGSETISWAEVAGRSTSRGSAAVRRMYRENNENVSLSWFTAPALLQDSIVSDLPPKKQRRDRKSYAELVSDTSPGRPMLWEPFEKSLELQRYPF